MPPAARARIVRVVEEAGIRLVLRARGDVLELLLGNVVLLSSAALETERVFGRLAAARPDEGAPAASRVLVGGLGFGATAQGALEVMGPTGEVVVVEKLAAVVALAREESKRLVGDTLDDPRLRLEVADVREVLEREARERPGSFDLLLLDVDNGPDWASFRQNAALYTEPVIAAAARALAPGGRLAVWSGYPKDAFLGTLRAAGLEPSVVLLEERGKVRARAYVGTAR